MKPDRMIVLLTLCFCIVLACQQDNTKEEATDDTEIPESSILKLPMALKWYGGVTTLDRRF